MEVSTDLLLRVLYALGYTARITFQKGGVKKAHPLQKAQRVGHPRFGKLAG
jgi:hypothetical protein